MSEKRLTCAIAGHNWARDDDEHVDHLDHVTCTRCGRSRVDRPRPARNALAIATSVVLIPLGLALVAAGVFNIHSAVQLWTYSCHFGNGATCGLVRSAGTSTFKAGFVKLVIGACFLFATWRLWRRRPVRWVLGIAVGVLVVGVALPSARNGTAANTAQINDKVAFPVGAISGSTSHQIAKLDKVASMLAGRHAIVNCWSVQDWSELARWRAAYHLPTDIEGETSLGKHLIQLSPFVCGILAQVLKRSANEPLHTAGAVTVLAHEAAHLSGIRAENQAECHAIATDVRAARLLGISPSAAAELPHIYRGSLYPYHDAQYRTPACRAGLPGAVIADTLGSATALRPLARIGTAVAESLPGWKDLGGFGSFAPLSPCAPIRSQATERLRFAESFAGPGGASVDLSSVRFKTRAVFMQSRAGQAKTEQCFIALTNRLIHAQPLGTDVAWPLPKALTRLSPNVRGFRDLAEIGNRFFYRDSFFIFDPSVLGQTHLVFHFRGERTPVTQELRTIGAALSESH